MGTTGVCVLIHTLENGIDSLLVSANKCSRTPANDTLYAIE